MRYEPGSFPAITRGLPPTRDREAGRRTVDGAKGTGSRLSGSRVSTAAVSENGRGKVVPPGNGLVEPVWRGRMHCSEPAAASQNRKAPAILATAYRRNRIASPVWCRGRCRRIAIDLELSNCGAALQVGPGMASSIVDEAPGGYFRAIWGNQAVTVGKARHGAGAEDTERRQPPILGGMCERPPRAV